ncbi:MAG: PIG-L family deacetylase [Candidatus Spechtbacteria bacterium SB0662_bin_43]|uniref:PIG-L family deacetylase n=1 Tax=Candidatus Spechtbacteria bacterium SB0662_bin_43 TaxID=2604897 RepID=A0A845DDD0_9BACT|nr:PIG-L family deacetylase [Candidatus Spechtbacteria bacterium SB0662_bin_43]
MEKQPEKRGLVVAAHPDDAEFGAGGTTALLSNDQWEMHYLVLTDGSKGTEDPTLQSTLVGIREKEQKKASEVLNVKTCSFAGATDGELEYARDYLGAIVKAIRTVKPHTILTHSPDIVRRHTQLFQDPQDPLSTYHASINHRDHRLTGEMTLDAVYPTARDILNFPEHIQEGLTTHKVKEVWLWGTHATNYNVDITQTIDLKIKALKCHASQVNEEQIDQFKERLKDKDGTYYERFQRIVLTY